MPDKANFTCVLTDVADVNQYSCFTCKYQHIYETSHEWIENFCKHPSKDGTARSPWDPCEYYEERDNK